MEHQSHLQGTDRKYFVVPCDKNCEWFDRTLLAILSAHLDSGEEPGQNSFLCPIPFLLQQNERSFDRKLLSSRRENLKTDYCANKGIQNPRKWPQVYFPERSETKREQSERRPEKLSYQKNYKFS